MGGRKRTAFAVLALAMLAAACSSSSTPNAGTKTTVDVTLQEFAVLPAVATAPSGDITFSAMNKGPDDTHEFVVFKTDLAPESLPTADDGSVDEEGAGVEAIGEVEDVGVGETKSVTFTLDPGNYVLICNLVEEDNGTVEVHYQLGMRTGFTVT